MRSRLAFLVIQIQVWLVVPMHIYFILLCHHSLTHPCTLGQDRIRLHLMATLHPMINRSQGLMLWQTPISSLFDDCWQRGRRIGLKLQDLFLKIQGVEKKSRDSQVSLWNLYLFLFSLVCLFQVGQTGLCNRSNRFSVYQNSCELQSCNIYPFPSVGLRKTL
jgi:hypothetical protein